MPYRHMNRGVIIVTLLIALVLDNLPLPTSLLIWRPQMTLLVLLYWLLSPSTFVDAGIVFIFGISTDLFTHSLLGQHAFAWLIAYWLLKKCHRYFHFHHPLHQGGTLLFPLVVNYLLIYVIQRYIGARPIFHVYLYALLTSLLFWPLVWVMLNKVERRYCRMGSGR